MKKSASIFFIVVLGMMIPTLAFSKGKEVEEVNVVNTESQPIPTYSIDNPATQPFQWTFNKAFDPTQGSNGDSFNVPAGKRLVIEFTSGTVGLEQGDAVEFGVQTIANGVLASHRLVLTPQGPAWGFPKSYQVSQDMRVYADPETTVTIWVTDNLTGHGVIEASVSGYLVDLP